MTNTVTKIKGTGIICKGNVEGNFEQVPMELFDYIQLGLITHTDLIVYVKLLQLYNENYGYAYPTVEKLMVHTRIGSKATIHNSLKKLGKVGLIYKSKGNRGNNVYVAYKPLSKAELYGSFPDEVEQFKEFKAKWIKIADQDKERFEQHLQEKQLREQQEQQIQARQIIPKEETVPYDDMENLSLKELSKLSRGNQ
ncbi:helix-turn-helix domain-containing protein [Bacillus nitratireducens]|uniref:helix-turn-helix domain-containing protein n=1 Tax=Bacillus nitratireducens TaxID=2026193 RepID=UPI0005CCC406|nr:helix-turn-helix domain-containing protein [Bacillus nitratireducens]UNP75079.1 helix-turn-helix domain-containing protein [Bacillus nitratireducens]SIR21994.1 Predicted transcriptional regulator [Bacillus cereus]